MADTLSAIRADFACNKGNTRARTTLLLYRVTHALRMSKAAPARLLGKLLTIPYVVISDWLFSVQIPVQTQIGPGLRIPHGIGLVVHGGSRIGANCVLRQAVTLGGKASGGAPVLEDGVNVGAGAILIGDITIGTGARIGAGSVVVKDVPAGSVVAGNPARVIRDGSEVLEA